MSQIVVNPGQMDSTAAALAKRASAVAGSAGNLSGIGAQLGGATGDPACDEAVRGALINLGLGVNDNASAFTALANGLRADVTGYVGNDRSSATTWRANFG
jgi:hypothetical protein